MWLLQSPRLSLPPLSPQAASDLHGRRRENICSNTYICIFNSHKNTSHETPGAAFFLKLAWKLECVWKAFSWFVMFKSQYSMLLFLDILLITLKVNKACVFLLRDSGINVLSAGNTCLTSPPVTAESVSVLFKCMQFNTHNNCYSHVAVENRQVNKTSNHLRKCLTESSCSLTGARGKIANYQCSPNK